jgi:hypothetical protein
MVLSLLTLFTEGCAIAKPPLVAAKLSTTANASFSLLFNLVFFLSHLPNMPVIEGVTTLFFALRFWDPFTRF